MEQQLTPFLIAALIVPLTFLSLFWFGFWNPNKTKSVLHDPLPPGTTGWPILGENIEFFSHGRKNTPEKFIEKRVNKHSSQVFITSLIGETVAVFCGQEGNKFVFSNQGNLLNVWWPKTVHRLISLPVGVSFYEELQQTRVSLRAFLKPEFLNRSTQAMDSLTKRHLLLHLDHKGKVHGCDLGKKYSFMTSCRLLLSIEDPNHVAKLSAQFNRILEGLMSVHINLPGTPYNRALKAKDYLRDEIINIIMERKNVKTIDSSSSEDILSYLLNTNDENMQYRMNNEAIIAVKIISMFLAHDAVNNVIAFTLKYLAELPHVYNQVLKEQREISKKKASGELLNLEDLQKMSYTWNVVNEVMRLTPTLQGTFSEAICDISYAGFSIPKGSKVHWNAFSTHRNPKYFPEPEKFDPTRYEGNGPAPYTFVPFGGGSRICPGMAYARCTVLVFLHNLVTSYSWKKLIPDENTFYDLLPRLQNRLPIQLQPHDQSQMYSMES